MTSINIEVIDSNAIDCDYYGSSYIARQITMTKADGNIQTILKAMDEQVRQAIQLHVHSGEIASAIAKKKNECSAIELVVKTSKRRIRDARRAIQAVDSNFDVSSIKDNKLAGQHETIKKLKAEIAELKAQERAQIAKEQQARQEANLNRFDEIIDNVVSSNESVKYKNLTLQKVLDSVSGSAYLYDFLIKDGWKVVERQSVNHITLGGHSVSSHDILPYTDHDFEVQDSRYF